MTKGFPVAIFGAASMSVLMSGGANSIIPELHRQVVDVQPSASRRRIHHTMLLD